MSMKKILIVHNFYLNKGGEDVNIIEELEFLNDYFEVSFFYLNNSRRINIFDIFAFFCNSNFISNKKFNDKLNEFQPDLVYVHNTWYKINLGIFNILKKKSIKTALKIHNFRYECSLHMFAKKHLKEFDVCNQCGFKSKRLQLFNKYFKNSYLKSFLIYIYSRKYFKILKNNPISIIALNEFHRKKLIDYGIDNSKINVICNPINFQNFKISKEKENIVVYAGRISEEKGVDEIIKSWENTSLKNFKLLIIGDGEDKKALENKNKREDIVFLGALDIDIVLDYISRAKAVVTATKLFEGQPRLLCEASSLGTLSIYPSFGGMDEFFPENYEFSFEQFNYSDLVTKLNKLNDLKKINFNQYDVRKNIQKKLSKDKIFEQFNDLI